GRKRLGEALSRRGCGLGAGLLVLAATSPAGASPPRLVEAILAATVGSPPAAVAALARGGSVNALVNNRSMLAARAAAGAVLGLSVAALQLPASQQVEKPLPGKVAAADGKTVVAAKEGIVSGRVLSPEGKPLAGAELLLVGRSKTPEKLRVTGADG